MLLALTGCTAANGGGGADPAPAFNEADVMFLQMSLEYADQGRQVTALAAAKARSPEVKAIAAELDQQWQTESGTMQRWLLGWEQPLTATVHTGHADLHGLRPETVTELKGTPAADFDRVAMSVLAGHLNNCVEVARLETAGGKYPPAMALATQVTTDRQAMVQRVLRLLA